MISRYISHPPKKLVVLEFCTRLIPWVPPFSFSLTSDPLFALMQIKLENKMKTITFECDEETIQVRHNPAVTCLWGRLLSHPTALSAFLPSFVFAQLHPFNFLCSGTSCPTLATFPWRPLLLLGRYLASGSAVGARVLDYCCRQYQGHERGTVSAFTAEGVLMEPTPFSQHHVTYH